MKLHTKLGLDWQGNIANLESMHDNHSFDRNDRMPVTKSPLQQFHDWVVFLKGTSVEVIGESEFESINEEKSTRSAPFPK
jgi:hypothetical protein